jgi:hypothetical protein
MQATHEIEVLTVEGTEVAALLRIRYQAGWRLVAAFGPGLQGGVWGGRRELYLERPLATPIATPIVRGGLACVQCGLGPQTCECPSFPIAAPRRIDATYPDDLSREDRIALETGAPADDMPRPLGHRRDWSVENEPPVTTARDPATNSAGSRRAAVQCGAAKPAGTIAGCAFPECACPEWGGPRAPVVGQVGPNQAGAWDAECKLALAGMCAFPACACPAKGRL